MGGVLDGLALIDEAAGIRGGGGRGSGGRWGGDGEAGAGMARLGNQDASALASELCVSGGRVGLRAALRLRERLADEVRGHGWVALCAGSGVFGRVVVVRIVVVVSIIFGCVVMVIFSSSICVEVFCWVVVVAVVIVVVAVVFTVMQRRSLKPRQAVIP